MPDLGDARLGARLGAPDRITPQEGRGQATQSQLVVITGGRSVQEGRDPISWR